MAEDTDREIVELKARLATLEQRQTRPESADRFSHLPSYHDGSSVLGRKKNPGWRVFGSVALAATATLGLAALLPNATVPQATSPTTGMSDLEASLTACKDAYSAAIDALQGSDLASLRSTSDGAATSCHSAAAALRRTPLPGHPNAAEGLDQAAEGFRGLKAAAAMLDRSPNAASRKANEAARMIVAGMKKLGS